MVCHLCKGTFCEFHGSLSAHTCPKADTLSATATRCPTCHVYIRVAPGEDGDAKLAEHMQSGCRRHARKEKKTKCALASCQRKLAKHQKITCRDCGHVFCVSHRSSHRCGDAIALRKSRSKTPNASSSLSLPVNLPVSKRSKVEQFLGMVRCSSTDAARLLKRGGWNVNRAIGLYFETT